MLNIVNVIAVIIFLVCWFFIIKKLVTDKISSVKSVKAVISHKYKTNTASKYPETLRKPNYVVIFDVGNQKRSFYVSEFSYNNYKIGEKGMLKYKGNKIVDFK